MPKTTAEIIADTLLKYADGHLAEAVDEKMGHPEQSLFERYIADLAAEIDQAIAEAST